MCHTRTDQSDISLGDQGTQAGVNLQKCEVLLVALECIKAGVTPTVTGKQTINSKLTYP